MHSHLKKNHSYIAILLFLTSISLVGCYENTDGCLNKLASNYDVSADNDCSDCCTFPLVQLSFQHLWDGSTFKFGDTLSNAITKLVMFDQWVNYSNVTCNLTDGTALNSKDSITLKIGQDSVTIAKNLAMVRKNQTTIDLFSFISEGTVENYSFSLGFPDFLNDITQLEADRYSPLDFSNNTRHNQTYASIVMSMIVGADLNDTITIAILEDYQFNIPKEVTIKNGRNILLPLTINYDKWFSGINFELDNAEIIKNKIIENTTNSFE